jgi:hypothetical protein
MNAGMIDRRDGEARVSAGHSAFERTHGRSLFPFAR